VGSAKVRMSCLVVVNGIFCIKWLNVNALPLVVCDVDLQKEWDAKNCNE
jgi:hypothetical protein